MKFKFSAQKATQAAARFLRLWHGNVTYGRLVKLLYIADREALKKWGTPITGDKFFSLPNGPIVSRIYDLSKGAVKDPVWNKFIVNKSRCVLTVSQDPGVSRLSRAEVALLDSVFAEHGGKTWEQLVEFCHTFKEWRDPVQVQKKQLPLDPEMILHLSGWKISEIRALEAQGEENEILDALLA